MRFRKQSASHRLTACALELRNIHEVREGFQMRPLLAGMVFACLLPLQTALAAPFGFDDVVQKARALADQAHSAPPTIPRFMRDIGHEAYRNIRFDPTRSLWRESGSRFQVRMLSAGHVYAHPVAINIVDAQGVSSVPYQKSSYSFADEELERRVPADLGHAGFQLSWPLMGGNEQVAFMSFAGASAFRVIGRANVGGASTRGIAVNTGLMSGEEFPVFTEFWLERPAPDAHAMKFHALLDGRSLTGAYQFTVWPGEPTRVQVDSVLFPRVGIERLGVAPLVAMFLHGENTGRPIGAWRPEAHDADGLLIHDGVSDEWLWRPLINPQTLQVDSFATDNVRGFGLLQRDTRFESYQDLAAGFEHRASTWVEPRGDWGKGQVMLVQLPTPDATNDNVVAFWSPQQRPQPDTPLQLSYQISFGSPEVTRSTPGRAINTFVGGGLMAGDPPGSYRFHVDFAGGAIDKLKPRAAVTANVTAGENSQVLEHFVEYNEAIKGWRLSILAQPAEGQPLSLRAFLREGDNTISETWSYVLPARNDIQRPAR